MHFKQAPMMDYHHIQPKVVRSRPQPKGDLILRTDREIRRGTVPPKVEAPQKSAPAICINILFEPEPEPQTMTVYTPFGPIEVDLTPRSPLEPFTGHGALDTLEGNRQIEEVGRVLPSLVVAAGLLGLVARIKRIFGLVEDCNDNQ